MIFPSRFSASVHGRKIDISADSDSADVRQTRAMLRALYLHESDIADVTVGTRVAFVDVIAILRYALLLFPKRHDT